MFKLFEVHFIVKNHKKGRYPAEQMQRMIAYFFERIYKFNVEEPVVIMFDLTGSGYSNTVIRKN